MKIGIVGLPNVGKSTIFQALTKKKTLIANYPFATINPSVGIVDVPDERVQKLTEISKSQKTTNATIEFVDIAGLVKGASEGEGLGNQFLAHIREVDAIAHVIRVFKDGDVVHVHGEINPKNDFEVIILELALADLSTVEKRIEKTVKQMKSCATKEIENQMSILNKFQKTLLNGKAIKDIIENESDAKMAKELSLLTYKPYFIIQNIGENEETENMSQNFDCPIVSISAKVEAELADLSYEEAKEFMKELGIGDSGLSKVIKTGYNLLGLITYFTSGEKETRAWTIENNTKAAQAAGKIHGDFEKLFIAAEVALYNDFIENNGWQGIKENGKMRLEGRDYMVKDGDICYFRIGR